MQPWRGFPRLSGRSTAGHPYAENRLVAVTITATGHRSEFGYDGLGRRVEIIEKDAGVITSDKKYLWDGVEIAQERSADGATVIRQFYSQGFVDNDGTILFYTRDHLGSIRELTDGTQAVRARYDYDPYGRMTKVQGDKDSLFQYTGHFWHAQSGLNLTYYRAYDPNLGRWISRDPWRGAEVTEGANLYSYVNDDPINLIDPLGLSSCSPCEEAKKKGMDGGASGGVVCKNGVKYPCFWGYPGLPSNNPNSPGVEECVLAHERAHMPDVNCPNSPGLSRPPSADVDTSEENAYLVSLKCIMNKLKKTPANDPYRKDYEKYYNDQWTMYNWNYIKNHFGAKSAPFPR